MGGHLRLEEHELHDMLERGLVVAELGVDSGNLLMTPDSLLDALDDLELDFEAYRAKKGGEPLELSPREFELLRYLIERKGETVTRDKLLEDVWGYESYPSTRTVDTHIAKLRAKIGDSGSEPRYILTIHGMGYKFIDP